MRKIPIRIFISVLIIILYAFFAASVIGESNSMPNINLDVTEISLAKGTQAKIKSTVIIPTEGIKAAKTEWTSSDESIAKVNNGNVRGIGTGKAIITCNVVLSDGTELSVSCSVEVFVQIKSIQAKENKLTINVGKSQKCNIQIQPEDATYKSLIYECSDTTVASVDAEGNIKGLKPGKAIITVSTTDGSKKSSKINVTVPSISGKTSYSIYSLNKEYDGRIRASELEIDYYGKGSLNAKSSNTRIFSCKVGKISNNKAVIIITPKREGTAKLTITDESDKSNKLVVSVTVSSSAVYYELKKGAYIQFWENNQALRISSVSFTDNVKHVMRRIRKQIDWNASYNNTYLLIKGTNGNFTGKSIYGSNTLDLWVSFDGGSLEPVLGFPTDYESYTPSAYQMYSSDLIPDGTSIDMMYFAEISKSKKGADNIWIYVKDSSDRVVAVCYYKEK